ALRDRRRDLPGEAAEQPGSAQLPDQVEQQGRRAAGRGRERGRTADRAVVLRVPHAVEQPRRAARKARRGSEVADAGRESAVAAPEAGSDQGRAVEGRRAENVVAVRCASLVTTSSVGECRASASGFSRSARRRAKAFMGGFATCPTAAWKHRPKAKRN